MSYSSCSCFCLFDRTIHICVSCLRAVKIWFFEYNSLILTTGCSTWHLMAKNSEDLRIRIVALHKDGLDYKKFGNTLKPSCSTVARVIQRFSKTGLTRNRPRKGRSKKLSPCAVRQVQKLASKNRRMSAASIALEVAEVEGQLVSAQTIRHTLQQVGLHGRRPRRKPLLKLAHKKACKQFAEDNLAKSTNYWNHVLWSDESKVNLFGSDGVQHVWWRPGEEYHENCALPTVKHGGGSIMVWGCMTTAGTGELQFIVGNMDSNMYCDILKQKMMPFLQKLFSNITTLNTPPRWQLPFWRSWRWRWWSGQVCLRPEPYWASVGHPQAEGGEALCV